MNASRQIRQTRSATSTNAATPDESATGTTYDGKPYDIARYGTLVIVTIDGESDDEQWGTESIAIQAFDDLANVIEVGP